MCAVVERERERVAVRSSDELVIRGGGVPPPRFSGVLALLGLMAAAVTVALLAGLDRPNGRVGPPTTAAAPGEAPTEGGERSPVVLEGTSSYAPGQSSGWHSHPGLHEVLIVEGTLTVYDEACNRRTFTAGQSYLGGDDVHLARNESDAPLEMTVTYIPNTRSDTRYFRVDKPAPTGCPVS